MQKEDLKKTLNVICTAQVELITEKAAIEAIVQELDHEGEGRIHKALSSTHPPNVLWIDATPNPHLGGSSVALRLLAWQEHHLLQSSTHASRDHHLDLRIQSCQLFGIPDRLDQPYVVIECIGEGNSGHHKHRHPDCGLTHALGRVAGGEPLGEPLKLEDAVRSSHPGKSHVVFFKDNAEFRAPSLASQATSPATTHTND